MSQAGPPHGPPSGPPSGPPPSPEVLAQDYGYQIVVVCAVTLVLQLVAVAGRFAARRVLHAPFSIDDWLIIPALV